MANKNYVTVDITDNFDTIEKQLSKISIAFSYALQTNRKIVLIYSDYSLEISAFFQIYITTITQDEFNILNFVSYDLNKNIEIPEELEGNICLNGIITDSKFINNDVKTMLNILIMHNTNYTNEVYKKLNEILLYFNDVELNNYICINIDKDDINDINNKIIDLSYYKNSYNNYFDKNKKIIVFSDNIEWCKENFKIIEDNKIYYYESSNQNKYETFILMAKINNHIINNSLKSWWCAYLGNFDKEVIFPSNTQNYECLDVWTKYT
jgi:hypothetical protein